MRRVLFVDHPESDYLAAQVYFGLCAVLGSANVIDWPLKKSYHGEEHRYPHPYQTDPGFSPHQTWEMTSEGAFGTTRPFDWLPAQMTHNWTREDVVSRIGEFSLVILASPRQWNVPALRRLIVDVGRNRMPPIVMIDGEDYEAIRWDLANEFRPRVYFKRELTAGSSSGSQDVYPRDRESAQAHVRVLPLPLAPIRVVSDDSGPLVTEVFMPGGANTPGGVAQWEMAVTAATRNCIFGYGSRDFGEYVRTIARSRIAVAMRGFSQDSLRSWEMLAIRGPLVAVQRHTLIRPEPFIDGRHIVEFGSPGELTTVLQHFLADEPSRVRIATAGHDHLRAHHTPQARAFYLLREAGVS